MRFILWATEFSAEQERILVTGILHFLDLCIQHGSFEVGSKPGVTLCSALSIQLVGRSVGRSVRQTVSPVSLLGNSSKSGSTN